MQTKMALLNWGCLCCGVSEVLQPTGNRHGGGCSLDGHGFEDQHLCNEVHQGHYKGQQCSACTASQQHHIHQYESSQQGLSAP